jgi:hypothetical protein
MAALPLRGRCDSTGPTDPAIEWRKTASPPAGYRLAWKANAEPTTDAAVAHRAKMA